MQGTFVYYVKWKNSGTEWQWLIFTCNEGTKGNSEIWRKYLPWKLEKRGGKTEEIKIS